jgi:D-arabinose 1-dehydrogenase-like Zn-dependent alcohol dehydrogenase
MTMNAAVVRSFDHPPRYETYDTPEPTGRDETVVDVLAAGLHPRVRTDASGRHYTSTGLLPMIPGIDGIGRLPGGQLVYFVTPTTAGGRWPSAPWSICAALFHCRITLTR